MADVPDFWPSDLGNAGLLTPVTILREEASYLGPKTGNRLKGEISSTTNGPSFIHALQIVAPGLNNYRYQLFVVSHQITLYPLTLSWANQNSSIATQSELIEKIKEILVSPKTRQIIEALLAQVASPAGT